MSGLELIGTDDLVKELLNRVDVGVVILHRIGIGDDGPEKTHGTIMRQWKGHPLLISGLATDMSMIALDIFHGESEDLDDGDFT